MRNYYLPLAGLLLYLCLSLSTAWGQQLKLQAGTVTEEYFFTASEKNKTHFQNQLMEGVYRVLVHVQAIPTEEEKKALREQGVQLLSYLPDLTFIAQINATTSWDILPKLGIDQVIGLPPSFKLSRQLADHIYPCLLYTSPSPRDRTRPRMPSSA